ncbi:uncharacterized protein Dvar_56260 [Desulfosarcina variabilis str. Montpellier]|uniref:hypothetical protein n=1 Tax=Desulfosarcina variabilis TaxID=2300 RepID=UPI003AFA51EC
MVFTGDEKTLEVAADAGRRLTVNAGGIPAEIIAVGIAAGVVVVAVGLGYGIYKGSRYLLNYSRSAS